MCCASTGRSNNLTTEAFISLTLECIFVFVKDSLALMNLVALMR